MTSDKSLREILDERKKYYVGMLLARARVVGLAKLENYLSFVANEAYDSGKLADIDAFEKTINSRITIGIKFGDLEEVVEEIPAPSSSSSGSSGVEAAVATPSISETPEHEKAIVHLPDNRPVLTYEAYCGARNSGKTHEEAKAMFKPLKPRQIGPYSRAYSRRKARESIESVKSISSSKPAQISQPSQEESKPRKKFVTPGLNYSLYCSLRESGKSDEEIKQKFSIDYKNHRFLGFRLNYEKYVLKLRSVGADETSEKQSEDKERKRPLPRLTQYQYCQARYRGWNLETIKARFRDVDESKISDFEKHYQNQLRRALDEITGTLQADKKSDNPDKDKHSEGRIL
ncbi:hypothetical protein J4447_01255 [Candidatus Pacearchaeota archaeon]|nr:hypothetical protein [Candidatus Pacearchaeota archaeon]